MSMNWRAASGLPCWNPFCGKIYIDWAICWGCPVSMRVLFWQASLRQTCIQCTRSHIAHTVACISYSEYRVNMILLIYITEQSFFVYHSIVKHRTLAVCSLEALPQNESAACLYAAIGDPKQRKIPTALCKIIW